MSQETLIDEAVRLRWERTDLEVINCPVCNGKGREPGWPDTPCDDCGGSGQAWAMV